MLEIIIPVLNEEKILIQKTKYYNSLKQSARIIFVDGGSTDRTVAIAREYGKVVFSPTGRAIQKNRGVQETRAEHILFLHVDTFVDEHSLDCVKRALMDGAGGGCLTMHIEDQRFIFRIYEWIVNVRARVFGVIDGDLGTFVQRDVFEQIGGFDHLPVMEDLIFGKKLRRAGTLKVLPQPIYVSNRKWREQGFMKTFLDYTFAYVQLWLGFLTTKNDHEFHYSSTPVSQKKV